MPTRRFSPEAVQAWCHEAVFCQGFLAGPLHNLGAALELGGLTLGRWVAQGGFAGEGVVPKHLQMERLGVSKCPTMLFNLQNPQSDMWWPRGT